MIVSSCLCSNNKSSQFKEVICYKNETVFKQYEGTIIAKCVRCGLLKTIPSKKNKLFDSQQSRDNFYENNSKKFIELFLPITNEIKKFKTKGTILDVGCSSGLLLSLLEKRGYKVVGVEPNRVAYRQAYSKFGKNIFHGTLAEYLNKHKLQFDCIIYNHVLEHVDNVINEIRAIKKILKKDGVLIIGVPNSNNIIFFLRQKYWESLMPNEHIWHFSSDYLTDLLNRFGFKVVNESYTDHDRKDYPFKKHLYFKILSIFNKLFDTGEAVLLVVTKE